jgi:hypothetical protein
MKRMLYILIILFFVSCAFALDVSGHIMRNSTWYPENNPYIVTAFLYVDEGVTLTILPGVEVQVCGYNKNTPGYFEWNNGTEPLSKMIVIYGRLIANGTPQGPIIFDKREDNPDYRWGGIYMHTESLPCSFSHCVFRNTFYDNSVPGVRSYGALDSETGHIIIRSCVFDMNYVGFHTEWLHSDMNIYDCQFISVNNLYPNTGTQNICVDPQFLWINSSGIHDHYNKLTIVKCYFKGRAILNSGFKYLETLYLNSTFDYCTTPYASRDDRLDQAGSFSYYGNLVINHCDWMNCYSSTVTDTSFFRKNRIDVTQPSAQLMKIGSNGSGVNIISDNFLYGNVQYYGRNVNDKNTYFFNNYLETTSENVMCLDYNGETNIGKLNIFNNFFRNMNINNEFYANLLYTNNYSYQLPIHPKVFNNTFIDYYSIMDGEYNAGQFINNIIFGFVGYTSSLSGTLPLTFTHNCLTESFPDWGTTLDGGGNIFENPYFMEPTLGDFQLQTDSPCIDAGVDLSDLPSYDVRYYKRAVAGTGTVPGSVDMGAYEYDSVYIGGIQGFVYDEQTGSPIDCVKIAIHDKLPEFSDTLGCFPFNTGSGTYTVTASRWDYDDVVIPNVVVNEGEFTVLNIPMVSNMVGNEDYIPPEVGVTISNYPNPFNPITTICFNITKSAHVNVTVYNIRGQKVTQLVDENMPIGLHKVAWNGKDENSNSCASGMYLYRLNTGDTTLTHKMMMVK